MEGKTPTEKIHNLATLLTSLSEQVQGLVPSLEGLRTEHSRTAQAVVGVQTTLARLGEQVAELQRWKGEMAIISDLKTEVAVLRREVDKLERVKEEWGRRLWMIAGPVLGAVVGWVLGYLSRR